MVTFGQVIPVKGLSSVRCSPVFPNRSSKILCPWVGLFLCRLSREIYVFHFKRHGSSSLKDERKVNERVSKVATNLEIKSNVQSCQGGSEGVICVGVYILSAYIWFFGWKSPRKHVSFPVRKKGFA